MNKRPSYIRVQLVDNNWVLLNQINSHQWCDNENTVAVSLRSTENGFSVDLSASKSKVKRLQLTFEHKFQQKTMFLGDAFERGYGDLGFYPMQTDNKMPWYFIAKCEETIEGWGIKTNGNALSQWQVAPEAVDLWLDIRSGTEAIELGNRSLRCAEVVFAMSQDEDSFRFVTHFCQMMAEFVIKEIPPIYGGNDWYNAYGNNSENLILSMTDALQHYAMGQINRPFMVIDDGWQLFRTTKYNGGPWNESNKKFPNMPRLVKKIKERDVRPGLWFRPLLQKKDKQFHEELILKNLDSETVILDPSHPDVLKQVKKDLQMFKKWGFELVKHDFSTYDIFGQWGFEMKDDYFAHRVVFKDRSKTTAEIIKQFYAAIREAAEDMLIIGCNTIGHLSVGFSDIQRTGDDTSGRDFSRTRKMGVNTLAFRMPQDRIFFVSDADCVGITESIDWSNNRKWFDCLARSGTPLFISFDPKLITKEIEDDLIAGFKIAASQINHSIPVDWEYHFYPQQWQQSKNMQQYNWYKTPRESEALESDKE